MLSNYTNSIEEFKLENFIIDKELAESISYFLSKQTKLNNLNLSLNEIGNLSTRILLNNFSSSSITNISLNRIKIDLNIGQTIIDFIKKQTNITVINLGYNKIRNKLSNELFNTCSRYHSSKITIIWLYKLRFDHVIEDSLLLFLKNQKNLTKINFGGNFIGNELGRKILRILPNQCQSLNTLRLYNVGINYEIGNNILSEFVKNQKDLIILDIGKNKIQTEIAISLINTLINKNNFQEIWLQKTDINDDITESILNFIKKQINCFINLQDNHIKNQENIEKLRKASFLKI